MEINGNIVDIIKRKIFSGKIVIQNKKIIDITEIDDVPNQLIMPGFIDSHILCSRPLNSAALLCNMGLLQ